LTVKQLGDDKTTKKGRQLFGGKKCIPTENPGYAPDSGPGDLA